MHESHSQSLLGMGLVAVSMHVAGTGLVSPRPAQPQQSDSQPQAVSAAPPLGFKV